MISMAFAGESKNVLISNVDVILKNSQNIAVTLIPGTENENSTLDDAVALYSGVVNLNFKKKSGDHYIVIKKRIPYDAKVTFGMNTTVGLFVYASYIKSELSYGVLFKIKDTKNTFM